MRDSSDPSSTSTAETGRLETLLDRYFAGEASAAEITELNTLYVARGGDAGRLKAGQRTLDLRRAMDPAILAKDTHALLERIARSEHLAARRTRQSVGDKRRLGGIVGLVGAVAIVAAFVLIRYPMVGHSVRNAQQRVRTYVTGPAQQANIALPNGTQIMLAPQSRLILYGNVATLTGEAFFTVTQHTANPFIVRTGAVSTRVLGTAFSVRHYADEHWTRVVVTEGKVATGMSAPVTVTANRVAYVSDSTIDVRTVDDLSNLTGWTSGRLVFRDVPARDVLAAVSRWYGITFRLRDSALALPVLNTALDTHRSRSEILAALELVLDVQMTAVGDTLIIAPRQAHERPAAIRSGMRDSFNFSKEIGR